jgi:peptidoglycan hydrolase-like protein with peptidoglycan-binding domain/3D (Asp-Asp-Asp) domain-containing protein
LTIVFAIFGLLDVLKCNDIQKHKNKTMNTNILQNLFFKKALYLGVAGAFAAYIGLFAWATPVRAANTAVAISDVPQTLSAGNVYVVEEKLAEPTGGQKQTFVISAYYSPIKGQAKYVTGSYSGDIRLNGGGVHGADGTDCYPGMIAAPKGYDFGTKMNIPGIGIVAVHDRGGAIVHSGQRGNSYDRLDVWMGYGDAGLKRAMKWGKRTVDVVVYGINADIKEEIYLEGYSPSEKYAIANTLTFNSDEIFNKPAMAVEEEKNVVAFTRTLTLGNKGEEVGRMQKILKDLGYYQGEINSVFDSATQKAVKKFQVGEKIVAHENAYGAGYVGPKTMKLLGARFGVPTAKAAETVANVSAFQRDLKSGDSGEDVRELQKELKRINLLGIEATGIYGELTAHAVFKFQQVNRLAGDKSSPGAGIFGPITRAALNSLVAERLNTQKMIADRKKEEKAS